jgi:hypothetical protein
MQLIIWINQKIQSKTSIYENVCLFVCLSWCWSLPNHEASCYVFGTIGKPLMSKGVLSSFHNVSTYDGQGIEYWTKFSMKIHFDWKKIWGNLGMLLLFLVNLQWVGINEGDLEIFRFKVWDILNFEYFCHWKFN